MTNEIDGPAIPDPAEATDGAELGERVGDKSLPGTVGFPPTTPAGVGPSGSLTDADHHDTVIERSQRENPQRERVAHDVVRLLDPNAAGQQDTEPELIGDAVPPVGAVSPEEAAMHIETDPQNDG